MSEERLVASRVELSAARHLRLGGFHAQALSRAYYAAFYAAEAALLSLGETRSKHSGVMAAFGQLAVRRGGFDEATARLLRKLFDRRNEADHGRAPTPAGTADQAIADAERFVDAVTQWLSQREAPPER